MKRKIEIMDTTLRDGEQTNGVSFSSFEKLQIARLLLEKLNVDRIEVASAAVSPQEQESVAQIIDWARQRNWQGRIEILGFVDNSRSVDWICKAGGEVINLLVKGSKRHCEIQLGKSQTEHIADIETTIQRAVDRGLQVQVYLEDWSNGFLNSIEYVRRMAAALLQMPIRCLLLPDTLGILGPEEVRTAIGEILERHPTAEIEFHGHNDYGLATANCLAAVEAGAKGLHVTVNGLGERAGNSPLEAVVTALHDKLGVKTGVNEKFITDASRLVETFSGKRIQSNRPIVGQDVYTQTAGIHADGDKKGNLYASRILPERFGRKRVYALGKLSGRASITNNLKMLGIELPIEQEKLLLQRIKELGEKKETITVEDLPFLIQDMFSKEETPTLFKIKDAIVITPLKGRPSAKIEVIYKGNSYYGKAEGDGGYDAFMKALATVARQLQLQLPELIDYEVRIPPGGKTDALVEAVIAWRSVSGDHLQTVGVSTDQVIAAIQSTEKMLNCLFAPKPVLAANSLAASSPASNSSATDSSVPNSSATDSSASNSSATDSLSPAPLAANSRTSDSLVS